MAFDLNKSKEEKTNSKFNLSKSSETSPVAGAISGTPSVNQASKGKGSGLLLFSILFIICLVIVIWFIANNAKSTDQKNAGTEQASANNNTTPSGAISSNAEGNASKAADAISDSSQKSNEAKSVQEGNAGSPNQANQDQATNANEGQIAAKSSISGNANIPYKGNETYQVYKFPFGEFNYSAANPELDNLAEALKQNPSMKISIFAYTDDIGPEDINMTISLLRAKSIHEYLVNKGIDAARMKFQGKGISTKYATKAENRRAEFVLSE